MENLSTSNAVLMKHDANASLTRPQFQSNWIRYSALGVLIVACLCVGGWVQRDPLLRGIANIWIVSDAVTKADVAVVLGGGLDDRPFAAAELYRKGLVNKVLVSQVRAGPCGFNWGYLKITPN